MGNLLPLWKKKSPTTSRMLLRTFMPAWAGPIPAPEFTPPGVDEGV